MILSASLVLLLGALVWFLILFTSLKLWHATVCVLFGFFLAATSVAPYIRTGSAAVVRFIAGIGS